MIKLAYSIQEAAAASGIGRSSIFELIRRRELRAVKFGRKNLIPAEELKRLIDSLPDAKGQEA